MTPISVRHSFLIKLQGLKGLFKTDGDIETYHSSFAAFLEEKGAVMIKDVHDNIIRYCDNHEEASYAITNCLFHQLKSSDPRVAIPKCSQLWADKCALISVEPELVISDVKQVEDFCVDQGEIVELIRIKLLLQRIRFRYNQILAENAYLLADALIALGKSQDAIKYLLRNSFLVVGVDEALYFLQKFYEGGFFNEANTLLDAIETKCRIAYEKWSESHPISFQAFILHINSITLSHNRDFERARDEFLHMMRLLKKLGKYQEDNEEEQQRVSQLREYLSAWNAAYLMWRYGFYAGAEKISSMSGVSIDNQWPRQFSLILNQFNEFLNEADRAETTGPEYDQLLNDIENLIQNYGYVEEDAGILIAALVKTSKRADILSPIVLEYMKKKVLPSSIRKENGADPSFGAIGGICNHELYRGYVDEKDDYPTVPERDANNCEDYLISLLRLVGFILGKAYRLRADGKLDEIGKIGKRVDALLTQINITLADRIRWDRSYGLPEAVMPSIFEKVFRFALEFNRDKIESLVELLAHKSSDQMGLYTEGFRECLYVVARMLIRHEDQKKLIWSSKNRHLVKQFFSKQGSFQNH